MKMHKMIIFIILTVLFMLLTIYVASNVLIITDRYEATFVVAILLCIYIVLILSTRRLSG